MKRVMIGLVSVGLMMLGAVMPLAGGADVWAAKKTESQKFQSDTKTGGQSFGDASSNSNSSRKTSFSDGDICDANNGISADLKEAAGCNLTKKDTAVDVVNNLISVAMGIMGLIAVGVMVYGGVQYTMSAGDSAKITKAKSIILYGIVGLIVALLAYAIVRFVGGAIGQ